MEAASCEIYAARAATAVVRDLTTTAVACREAQVMRGGSERGPLDLESSAWCEVRLLLLPYGGFSYCLAVD